MPIFLPCIHFNVSSYQTILDQNKKIYLSGCIIAITEQKKDFVDMRDGNDPPCVYACDYDHANKI